VFARSISGLSLFAILLLGAAQQQPQPDVSPVLVQQDPASFTEQPDSAEASPTFEDQVMELLNQERWKNGQLPPLKRNAQLNNASEQHSGNMAGRNFFAHCDLDNGQAPWDRMRAAGYNWNAAAENIAAGHSTPADVISGWMNSPGHRANILSTNYREVGIGYGYQSGDQKNVRFDNNGDCQADSSNNGPYGHYWTQDFGASNGVYPVVINREAYQTNSRNVSLYVYGAGWAQELRLRNDNGAWSAWQPYSADVGWTLNMGSGAKTVYAEIRNGGAVYGASDTIVLNDVAFKPTAFVYLPAVLRR